MRSTSLAPAGFLTSRMRRRAAAEVERLGAAERGRDGLQAGDHVVELDAEAERQRGGAERVVDVVEAGERELDAAAAAA